MSANFSAGLDSGPMTDGELDRLAELLERYADPETGLNLEGTDGFLSAVVVGPGAIIMPGEYLPEIFDCEPAFENEGDAQETLQLLMRLNNHIVWRVGQGEDGDDSELQPMLMMPAGEDGQPVEPIPQDFPLAAAWALGFMRAVQLRADDWQAWCERHEDIAEDFSSILDLTLVLPEQLEEFGIDPEIGLPNLADREEIASELGDMLVAMNERRLLDLRPRPARRTTTAGRNDLCPCGSGRKYKKCCGDPERSLN